MSKTILVLFALFLLHAEAVFAREKRNYPKDSEAVEILRLAKGTQHKVDEVERLESIKTDAAYLHIFAGNINDDSYRVIIFDNQKQYLGFYDTGSFEPYKINGDGDDLAYRIVFRKEGAKEGETVINVIPLGRNGPWKKIHIKSHKHINGARQKATSSLDFTPTDAYTSPVISSEMREWRFRGGLVVYARLAMLDDSFIYVQTSDDSIEILPREFISDDDKKYIKSVKQTL